MANVPLFTKVSRVNQFPAQHQITAFFILTFAFSWAIWFMIPDSNLFSKLGNYGPFLAAVILSAVLSPETVKGGRVQRWALFVLVFTVVFLVWILITPVLAGSTSRTQWPAGAAVAGLISLLVSGPLSGRSGVRELLEPLRRWRVSWISYAAALVVGAGFWLLPAGLDLALGGRLPPWPRGVPTLEAILAAAGWIALFGGGEEEVGWRGFALPRLQRRFSPLIASLILSPFWSLWHMPLYFNGKYTAASNLGPAAMAGILTRFIWEIPVTILFTWLYNRSRGSLTLMILLHAVFNATITFVGLSDRAGVLMFLCTSWIMALAVVLWGRMWRKVPAGELIDLSSSATGQPVKNPGFSPEARPQ